MLRHALLASAALAIAAPAFSQIKEGRDFQEDVYVTPYWTRAPVIEALGRSELEIAPNTATFLVAFLETDRDASVAMTKSVDRAKRAYEAIKRIGGDQTIAESSVEVEAYYEQYKDESGDMIENIRPDKIRGYSARASIEVEVNGDLELAGRVRAAALAAGPEESTALDISTKVSAAAQRAAYKAAVADAAARASESAEAAGTKLGELLVIQEGNGPCLGRWDELAIGRVGSDEYSEDTTRTRYRQAVAVTAATKRISTSTVPISEAEIDSLDLPSDVRTSTITSSVCLVYAVGD